jgi:hypothetical protein
MMFPSNHCRSKLEEVAKKHEERLLVTPHNNISIGMTLSNLSKNYEALTLLGSMLFSRCCSGARVVVPSLSPKTVLTLRICFAEFLCYC